MATSARRKAKTQIGRPSSIMKSIHTPNPFMIPDSTQIYNLQEEKEREQEEERQTLSRMKLKNRNLAKSPTSSHRSVKLAYEEKMTADRNAKKDEIRPVTEIRQRQQQAKRLVEEQREIFLSNLLISRHQKELERIEYQKEAKMAKLEQLDTDFREEQNRSKTTCSQYETSRNRERTKYEELLKRRQAVDAQVKQKSLVILQLKSEITRLEDIYNQYTSYDELVNAITAAYGKRPESTNELLDFYDSLENENLFIVSNFEGLQAKQEESELGIAEDTEKTKQKIAETDKQIELLLATKKALQEDIPHDKIVNPTDQQIDTNLIYLQKIIAKSFRKCFPGTDTSQNSLAMLALIEAKIKDMSTDLTQIDPTFVVKKMKRLNDQKRKEQREHNQEKKARDQQFKLEQMMARATKPIKRKQGRPLTARVIPARITKKDTAKLERELAEKKRLDDLLYGDFTD